MGATKNGDVQPRQGFAILCRSLTAKSKKKVNAGTVGM